MSAVILCELEYFHLWNFWKLTLKYWAIKFYVQQLSLQMYVIFNTRPLVNFTGLDLGFELFWFCVWLFLKAVEKPLLRSHFYVKLRPEVK